VTAARVLVDTNVVSYVMKGGPLAEAYAPHLQGRLVSISFMTVGELYYGAEKARWGQPRRLLLESALRNFVVIPYDHEIAKHYGRVAAERERSPKAGGRAPRAIRELKSGVEPRWRGPAWWRDTSGLVSLRARRFRCLPTGWYAFIVVLYWDSSWGKPTALRNAATAMR